MLGQSVGMDSAWLENLPKAFSQDDTKASITIFCTAAGCSRMAVKLSRLFRMIWNGRSAKVKFVELWLRVSRFVPHPHLDICGALIVDWSESLCLSGPMKPQYQSLHKQQDPDQIEHRLAVDLDDRIRRHNLIFSPYILPSMPVKENKATNQQLSRIPSTRPTSNKKGAKAGFSGASKWRHQTSWNFSTRE